MAGSDTVVSPNVADLRATAKNFLERAGDLAAYIADLDLMRITPGSFGMAGELVLAFNDAKKALVLFLKDFQFAFKELGRQLLYIADKYQDTENLNADDAQRVAELIQAFHSKYPEVSGIVPVSTNYPPAL